MRLDLTNLCDRITEQHRIRCFAMKQRMRERLALLAFLRTQLGWTPDLPTADRNRIATRAKAIVTGVERGANDLPDELEKWRDMILSSLQAAQPFVDVEKAALRKMERLAKQLPVWSAWAEDIKGFGAAGLAVIVGEAGDLSNYPKKGHLWKRMGVAVIGAGDGLDDHRQGAPGSGATKQDWIAEAYNKERRSRLWAYVGEALMKQGPYREVYLARKTYEVQRAAELGLSVVPAAKIPAGRKAEFRSEGAVHLRAHRYMEKRLLRDLWRAWRASDPPISVAA